MYGANVNYYKSDHHPIPTLPVGTGNILAIFKTSIKSSFKMNLQIYSFLAQIEGEKRPFLEGCKKGQYILRLPPRALVSYKR